MHPTCCYDTARRLAEHWMEALLVQVVVLGATWLIPRLAQHAPTRMEVNDPSVFRQHSQGPIDQAEHQHVGETFSKVSWPDSQRGVGGHQITHNPSASFITSDNICHIKSPGVGVPTTPTPIAWCWCRFGMEIPIATARLTADFEFFTKSALNRSHSEDRIRQSKASGSNVAAAPFQFLPNDAEERYVRHYGKRQSLVSFPNRHDRADFQG